jgi:heme ABC exporter ATP-binding subunit CcmA
MPSRDGAPLLEARGLQRSFGRVRILHGIDLTLHAGEALAVIGPNGAGKTTLLRLLAGLLRPEAGKLRVLGAPVRGGDFPGRRAIGFLSHQSMLYDDLTLLENLALAARLYGLERPTRVAAEALETAGLGRRATELPRRLSRGLLQRAAIARALLHSPSLILMDEPFTALDATAADQLRAELGARLAAGAGIVMVTHQLTDVWDLAARVAVLAGGRWIVDEPRAGSLETFLPRYQRLTSG